MSYKFNQVLRTRVPLKTVGENGVSLPVGTRVVVTSVAKDGLVRARVTGDITGKVAAKEGAFNRTFPGRPKKVKV